MTHFICLSAPAQNGKDTSAEIIKKALEERGYSVLVTHYADLLKFICKNFFGWNGEKDEAGRTLLQRVGTDCIRAQDPDYWVDFITNLIRMFPETYDFVVVADTRFPNEIDRVSDAGFPVTHVRIYRPHFDNGLTEEQKNHPSETALDNATPDAVIINTTMSVLKDQLEGLCEILAIQKGYEKAI